MHRNTLIKIPLFSKTSPKRVIKGVRARISLVYKKGVLWHVSQTARDW
jgi:hypothetical protein